VAVSLVRPDDITAVAAWLECDAVPDGGGALWDLVASQVATRPAGEVVERGILLGLPVAAVGDAPRRAPVELVGLGAAPGRPDRRDVRVVDLTALWAGPLCGDLLATTGASVVKVESTARPDGARRGDPAFFDLLNGHKQSVALDFTSRDGRAALRALVAEADIVLESSRPRALEQLGINATELVAGGGPQVWVSITGFGRTGTGADRVAFGDDAAVAGGLVVVDDQGHPCFCADAVADPLAGLTAADACLRALESGGRWLLDVSMAAVAADLAGPTLTIPPGLTAAAPRARKAARRAPIMGADTALVLGSLGGRP
jgi:crotonobetainyl-CoA:carnitine CoA-transferase CaiB-like acyl-CoA transferase